MLEIEWTFVRYRMNSCYNYNVRLLETEYTFLKENVHLLESECTAAENRMYSYYRQNVQFLDTEFTVARDTMENY